MDRDCVRILREQVVCALATSRDDFPHCSLMGFIADESGTPLYVATTTSTKKYENLVTTGKASVLVDSRGGGSESSSIQALTLSCTAQELHGSNRQQIIERLKTERPFLSSLLAAPNIAVFALHVREVTRVDSPTDILGCDL